MKIGWHIGLVNFIGFYNPFTLEKKLFKFLHEIYPHAKGKHPINLYNGHIMPSIMQDWLCGLSSSTEILEIIRNAKPTLAQFNKSERKLIIAMAKMMFTPEIFSQTVYPVKDASKLLKKLYQKKDAHGQKMYKIYILSNWDPESFDLLCERKRFKKLFKYTDGIVISGKVHKMKPAPEIFYSLFETYQINPEIEKTIFIDDDLANISTAKRLGIKTIQCRNIDLKEVENHLKKLGIK
jgi:FMN phosphatase YigB (HAD superfamily)